MQKSLILFDYLFMYLVDEIWHASFKKEQVNQWTPIKVQLVHVHELLKCYPANSTFINFRNFSEPPPPLLAT